MFDFRTHAQVVADIERQIAIEKLLRATREFQRSLDDLNAVVRRAQRGW